MFCVESRGGAIIKCIYHKIKIRIPYCIKNQVFYVNIKNEKWSAYIYHMDEDDLLLMNSGFGK